MHYTSSIKFHCYSGSFYLWGIIYSFKKRLKFSPDTTYLIKLPFPQDAMEDNLVSPSYKIGLRPF